MSSLTDKMSTLSPEKQAYVLNMPFHYIQAQELERLGKVLTNFEFIENKARYDSVFSILQDYAHTNATWQDTDKQRQKQIHRETLQKYIEELFAYSDKPEITACPEPPLSETALTSDTCDDQPNTLSCVDYIKVWEEFVRKNTQAIRQEAAPLFQLALNNADASPIVADIERRLKSGFKPKGSWMRLKNPRKSSEDSGLVRVLEGVEDQVNIVVSDSAGGIVAAGGYSGIICIWDVSSGLPLHVLNGHAESITALTTVFDMAYVISGSQDGTVRIWDTCEAECVGVLDGHKGRVKSIATTPIGRLAITLDDDTVRIWDLFNQKCIQSMAGGEYSRVAITTDGNRMLLGGAIDGAISIWDIQSQEFVGCLPGHESSISALIVTPDGKRAVSGSHDQKMGIWDLIAYECLGLYDGHDTWISDVALTPDGRTAVSGSGDGTLRLWDLHTDASLVIQRNMNSIQSVAISSDGRVCFSAALDGGLHVWNLQSSNLTSKRDITATILSCSPTLEKLVWLQRDGALKLVQGDSKQILQSKERPVGPAERFVTTSDMSVGLSEHKGHGICVWDLDAGKLEMHIQSQEEVLCLKTIPGSEFGYVVWGDWCCDQLDLQRKTRLKSIMLREYGFRQFLSMSNCGRYAVFSDADNVISWFDIETNKISVKFTGHTGYVSAAIILPDGNTMVSEALDNTLRVWVVHEQRSIKVIQKRAFLPTLTLSPRGNRIVVGDGYTVAVLDASTGSTLHFLHGHNHFVNSVYFSPDGNFVITCGQEGSMRIWDVESGKCIASHVTNEGKIWTCTVAWPYIMANTQSGMASILRIENPPVLEPACVSAKRLWLFNRRSTEGGWDNHLTAVCYYCGRPFEVKMTMAGEDFICPDEECGKKLHINKMYWDRPLTMTGCG
ncbi:WD40 repeat domain-containing protein [Planctomycetota bacterium]